MHDFAPLGGWYSLDRFTATQQPDNVMESHHYEKLKTVVKIYKVSDINFSVMCLVNVDMDIKALHAPNKISKKGTYKDGTSFVLGTDKMKLVNGHTKEICLAVYFLSLSLNKLYSQSKQELKHDLIKGRGVASIHVALLLR